MSGENIREEVIAEEDCRKFLTFLLRNELYGIDITSVREVIEYIQATSITRIPLTPNYIGGVINLRGEVTPVIDLSARFFNITSDITKRTCIAILEMEDEDENIAVGIIIDAVNAVVDIPVSAIEETPGFGAKLRSDFINGIGTLNDKFIILLNPDNILNIKELSDFKAIRSAEQILSNPDNFLK